MHDSGHQAHLVCGDNTSLSALTFHEAAGVRFQCNHPRVIRRIGLHRYVNRTMCETS